MPVIAFANSKGGSGKTTSALLLAQALAANRPTTLIDADPRHPITTWAEEAAARDPSVIIDLEGTASRLMSYAISQSDLVVIPTKEQQQDALAVLDVIHRDLKATRRKIPYSVLFTQSQAAVKSRTARHIAAQFRGNTHIGCFETEGPRRGPTHTLRRLDAAGHRRDLAFPVT